MVDCRVKGGNCHKIIVNKPNLRVFSVKKKSFVDVFFLISSNNVFSILFNLFLMQIEDLSQQAQVEVSLEMYWSFV